MLKYTELGHISLSSGMTVELTSNGRELFRIIRGMTEKNYKYELPHRCANSVALSPQANYTD
jgi:hypothetical protein